MSIVLRTTMNYIIAICDIQTKVNSIFSEQEENEVDALKEALLNKARREEKGKISDEYIEWVHSLSNNLSETIESLNSLGYSIAIQKIS